MLGGGFHFGDESGGDGGGTPQLELLILAILVAFGGLLFGSGIVKVLVLAGVLVACKVFGLLTTAYCIKVSILVAVSVVVFWGAQTLPLLGAVVIGSLWHFVSVVAANPQAEVGKGQGITKRQEVFFDGIFSLLGYIAKADGVVSKRELNFAATLMTKMNMNADLRARARLMFERGKIADFDIDKTLELVRKECKGNIGMFMRILSHAALINGKITEVERRILQYVGVRLGLSQSEIEQIEAAVRSGESYQHREQSQSYGGGESYDNRNDAARPGGLLEAYKILGVVSNASNGDIKRSYRRLMSRHHPDKLAAKGIPPEMMRVATERAQDISSAYERIKKARNI